MHITIIKKTNLNGNDCPKSAKVLKELKDLGLMDQINEIIVADEREPSSEGFALALKHDVEAAPFFIVTDDDGSTRIYKAYHKFIKEIFDREVSESDEISEIMAQNPDLDFI